MAWDCDSLWAKSCAFMERAFLEARDDPMFGFWASLALELLARSAVAQVSPTLLAEPDKDHKHLLHALGRGSKEVSKKSISADQVFNLCKQLFPEFNADICKVCIAIKNRRNEELHTGNSAFGEYPTKLWLSEFYRACKILSEAQTKTLHDFFGEAEATNAEQLLSEKREELVGIVKARLARHKTLFDEKPSSERSELSQQAERKVAELTHHGHHRVVCPSCGCAGAVSGSGYGPETVSLEDEYIQVRQPISPNSFKCFACALTFTGYVELELAGIGGRYTRRTTFTPEEYYGIDNENEVVPVDEYDNE